MYFMLYKVKITLHTKSTVNEFLEPLENFQVAHIDLIDPLFHQMTTSIV